MEHSINTSYAVIVLGDRDTVAREDLAEKAAEQGAHITEIFSFDPGSAAPHDDLTEVEVVVTALSRAIATRTDIWMPFPMQDLGREAHVRRASLVLQRHGLNMLFGRELEPCAMDGGFSEIDFALRVEVKAVDELDQAVIAGAGVATLTAEIERELADTGKRAHRTCVVGPEPSPEPEPDTIGERFYGTSEVAKFFGKSNQWVYWALREGVFSNPDGTAIEPIRIGKSGRRRFTVPMLRAMARACYRRGILDEDGLLDLLAVLSCEEDGP